MFIFKVSFVQTSSFSFGLMPRLCHCLCCWPCLWALWGKYVARGAHKWHQPCRAPRWAPPTRRRADTAVQLWAISQMCRVAAGGRAPIAVALSRFWSHTRLSATCLPFLWSPHGRLHPVVRFCLSNHQQDSGFIRVPTPFQTSTFS